MYINEAYNITNTPSGFTAAYNTWPYYAPRSAWFQSSPRYYVDVNGNVREWNSWSRARTVSVPGGQYKGTPTRTGPFYAQNTITF
jgi:hypothetical protein